MAIRRPPTTFSDTISTADIADDAISGDKLANDIAISTTGNIATTGSGTLTVAGNTTLSGTNNLGSNPTLTLGSNATFPTGHVIRHFYDEHDFDGNEITISGDIYWSDLEIEVTNPSTSNYILVTTMIPSIYNTSTNQGLNIGFAYSTDNWTTPQTLGPQAYYDAQVPWAAGVIVGQSYTARFAHPTTSNYKIRMRLNKYTTNNINIGQAGSGTQAIATMSGFEIQG